MGISKVTAVANTDVSHMERRLLLGLGLTVMCTLAACDAVFDSDMANLKADMQETYRHRNQKISKFLLTRDTRYQVSGMIYVDIEYLDGVKTYYTPCVAKMDPVTRKFTWSCDKVP
jgi:hypothetical protein